ncbi:MAG: flagellar basal body rod protein FlgB [candidate division KSB1 bacterium]|nr:flagellar basal body rod protein FlgB [candidate division KSB1 bacterium]MDZ7385525.1 flagellar basal body rod protein FlgB [candidate division KSB1 bacterium]MDZ7392632.1 flagellar basal body rod protein FlgB [candidate division KSB1 bacterium]MDZ7412974.1 flagellar basal body rod protein FlgB [candidate division KSB1 bacterium]
MLDGIFARTSIPLLHRILNLTTARERAIASNVANVNTPGYRRKDVAFEELLAEATGRGFLSGLKAHERHMDVGGARLAGEQVPLEEVPGTGGAANDVNIETEMVEMAKTQLTYLVSAQLISNNFKALLASIRGRT